MRADSLNTASIMRDQANLDLFSDEDENVNQNDIDGSRGRQISFQPDFEA